MSCLKSSQNKVSNPFYLCNQMHFWERQDTQQENNAGLLSVGNWVDRENCFLYDRWSEERGWGKKSDVNQTCKSFQRHSKSLHFDGFLWNNVHWLTIHNFKHLCSIFCIIYSTIFSSFNLKHKNTPYFPIHYNGDQQMFTVTHILQNILIYV